MAEARGQAALEEARAELHRVRCDARANQSAAGRVGVLEGMLEDKEQLMGEYREKYEEGVAAQDELTSEVAAANAKAAAAAGECDSLRALAADQTRFVASLNEENGKLVQEIKRLKTQADVRDGQLQESLSMAKTAILREKQKRTQILHQMGPPPPDNGLADAGAPPGGRKAASHRI